MKRTLLVLGIMVVVLLGLYFFWLAPKRFGIGKTVVIRSSVPVVAKQLIDLNNWRHWYPDADKHLFSPVGGNSTEVVVLGEGRDSISLKAFPGADSLHTRVVWETTVGWRDWLFKSREREMERGLDSLKGWLEGDR